jgi:hypothetical protein
LFLSRSSLAIEPAGAEIDACIFKEESGCMKKAISVLMILVPVFCAAQQNGNNAMVAHQSMNQLGIYAGMGINATYDPSVVDYLKVMDQSSSQVSTVATAVEFFGGFEVPVSPSWALKAEHSYLFKSYTLDATSLGREDLRYDVQAPSLMAQYVIPGKGYFIKFGAGGGYHWGKVTVNTSIYGQQTVYTAHGIGGRAEAEGQTAFDEHLFGYISLSLGFEAMGKVKSDDGYQLSTGSGSVALNYMTAGLRFGLMYYF